MHPRDDADLRDSVRMSDTPRPSIRTRSRRMRCRTTFLVRARYAPISSFARPSNWPPSCSSSRPRRASVCSSRRCLSTDRHDLGQLGADGGGDRLVHLVGVVEEDGNWLCFSGTWLRARPERRRELG